MLWLDVLQMLIYLFGWLSLSNKMFFRKEKPNTNTRGVRPYRTHLWSFHVTVCRNVL